jgi:hypothetical protein
MFVKPLIYIDNVNSIPYKHYPHPINNLDALESCLSCDINEKKRLLLFLIYYIYRIPSI